MTQDKTHWIPTKRAFPDIAEPEREQRKTEVEACYDGFTSIQLTSKSAKGDGAGASAVAEEAAGAGAGDGDGAGAGTSRCRQSHVSAAAARAAASALADLAAANV